VALLFTQYTPYRLPNGKQIEITNEYKENYYRSVINSIEEYAPGFEKLIIGRDMLFPSDLEEQFSLTGTHFNASFLVRTMFFKIKVGTFFMVHCPSINSIHFDQQYRVQIIELLFMVFIYVEVQIIQEVNHSI
jgi:phytoene dehydrogenase-like protein